MDPCSVIQKRGVIHSSISNTIVVIEKCMKTINNSTDLLNYIPTFQDELMLHKKAISALKNYIEIEEELAIKDNFIKIIEKQISYHNNKMKELNDAIESLESIKKRLLSFYKNLIDKNCQQQSPTNCIICAAEKDKFFVNICGHVACQECWNNQKSRRKCFICKEAIAFNDLRIVRSGWFDNEPLSSEDQFKPVSNTIDDCIESDDSDIDY